MLVENGSQTQRMQISSGALRTAATALQQISDANAGERGRRAGVLALVLQTIERAREGAGEERFLRRRAELEVQELPGGSERALLSRLLSEVDRLSDAEVGELLVSYASGLESARRLAEADAVISLARSVEPERAELALRAAR